MDAIVGVWITSVVGAAAFSAAGYVLGQSKKVAPVVLPPPARTPSIPPPNKKVSEPKVKVLEAIEPAPETKRVSVKPNGELATPKTPTAFPTPELLEKSDASADDDESEERPTVIPDTATQAAVLQSSVVTIPPPQRAPSLGVPSFNDTAATRAMIQDALAQVEHAAEQTKALEVVKQELERQLELARAELRNEVVQRAAAESRAEELSDRLVSASEEAASLRHRVNMLDRQTRLLRESLKRPSGETRVRRDLEEAEEMRAKLRDVVDKLERASLPPPSGSLPMSARITAPPESRPLPGAPGIPRSMQPSTDDAAVLREEIARLASENRHLRAQTLGSLPPKTPRDTVPEIDLPKYERVIARLGSVAGLKCAVLADEVGSLVLGHGDLAENLAAFGAYIRDASARTERLLPLEGVEEVDIRDKAGMHLSTRVVLHDSALSIVLLANADASIAAAKKVLDENLRGRG